MANSTAGNWVLDTAGVIKTGLVHVGKITWDSPTTANHGLVIKDNGGNVIWDIDALAAGSDIRYELDVNQVVNGFNLETLDSGTVHVQVY